MKCVIAAALALTTLFVPGLPEAAAATSCFSVTAALLDQSGSFKTYLPSAILYLKGLVRDSAPGSCLIVRSIASHSFGEKGILLILAVPSSDRPIDASLPKRVFLAKRAALLRLENIARMKLWNRTDIWEAIFATAADFHTFEEVQKTLIILSDMKDTLHKGGAIQLDLKGVSVSLVTVQEDDPDIFARRNSAWSRALEEAGATVRIESLTLSTPDMEGAR